jgi:hypothetical protein
MSARKRRWRRAVKPTATTQVRAAAKPLNIGKSTRPALVLPVVLADRLTDIEARITAVEQLTICPMACARERCAFQCPTPEGGAR